MLFRTVFALLFASAAAFSTSKPTFTRPTVMPSTTARALIMTDEETEVVLSKASDCVEGECSVDEVDDLLKVLKGTEKELEDRLEKIMNMIAHLQHVNQKEERKTDEVRAFVKDMLRVFNTDKPLVYPAGFSGDAGKAKTAWDVLPPKKWTNPDKK
mmetsp:Transcript_13309/g.24995  ORF Transcript_13309/g.24995 Transcript_13309/m.24995 type:complete len:156 (-) Transcript_13309:532-999(-)